MERQSFREVPSPMYAPRDSQMDRQNIREAASPMYAPSSHYQQYLSTHPRNTHPAVPLPLEAVNHRLTSPEQYARMSDSKGKDTGFSTTLVSSSASSILEGKEGHDIEHAKHGGAHVDCFDPNRPKLGFKQRLHHFTWAWYTFSMATGGLSLLIFAQPHSFPGLRTIGLIFYIVNLFIFFGISSGLLLRFVMHKGDFGTSLAHVREGFFLPTFFLSVATLITSTHRYALPLNDVPLMWAVKTAFWTYLIMTTLLAVGQYSFVFSAHSYSIQSMMPTWILPIFPIMLSGTIASVIADTQPDISAVPIIIGGLTCQGLGISVSFLMYGHMVGRLMQSGLPNREHRTGLYMCVGPPAFTALALIGMANGLPNTFGPGAPPILDPAVIRTLAVVAAIFLWGLAFWWFCIATIAVIASPPKYFHLGWWAMVFPNTGFTLATISIGKELQSDAIGWVATGMSIVLILLFHFILYNLVVAVIKQEIMYPGRDEDVDDH